MRKRTFYVAGNLLVREDSVPLKIMGRLQKKFPHHEFKEFDPTEDFPKEESLNILDTVVGPEDVQVIKDVDKIVTGKVYSLHNFDLGFNLKLMKKAGKLKSLRVIGIPAHMDEDRAFREVSKKIISGL